MRTVADIKDGLKCKGRPGIEKCEDCVYLNFSPHCIRWICDDALEYIAQLEDKIRELESKLNK